MQADIFREGQVILGSKPITGEIPENRSLKEQVEKLNDAIVELKLATAVMIDVESKDYWAKDGLKTLSTGCHWTTLKTILESHGIEIK